MPSNSVLRGGALKVRPLIEKYVCPSCRLNAVVGANTTRSSQPKARHQSSFNTRKHAVPPLHARLPAARPNRNSIPPLSIHIATSQVRDLTQRFSFATNAPITVPPSHRDLYQSLLALEAEASTYIDLSRLQLAARSLETDQPTIRVALLGLGANGSVAARKLARVLLSDPLSEEQSWEQELIEGGKDGRSVLLVYGEVEESVRQSPMVETMRVPSLFLKRHNVEILVTTLNSDSSGSGAGLSESDVEQAVLVPTLTMPNSQGGRVGFVRYPVHKAVIVAEGIPGAIGYARLPRFLDKAELIRAVLSLPLHKSQGAASTEEAATDNVVDIDLATHSLKVFRASNSNGAIFGDEWQTSRMSSLSDWIATPQAAQHQEPGSLHPAVRQLLNSVILSATATIERSETTQRLAAAKASVPDSVRDQLNTAISETAAKWHLDLRLNLEAALQSPTWRRTAWWRLLWRIDDISASASTLLLHAWLAESEQLLSFLSGQLVQAGLATEESLQRLTLPPPNQPSTTTANTTPLEPRAPNPQPPLSLPTPPTISLTRTHLLTTTVPALHRRAQILLLSALTTTTTATGLGSLLFLSSSTTAAGLQLGGAVAALGFVWSLRRLQSKWGKERAGFAETLRERGREVLAEVEGELRRIVREGGRVTVREEEVRGWKEAREAVGRVREALEEER